MTGQAIHTSRVIALAVAGVSLAALVAALIAEYSFGLKPCILCLYQRVPYGVGFVLGGLAVLPMMPPRFRRGLVGLAGLGFLTGMGIAAFHVGVEQHWWAGTSSCSSNGLGALSIAEMQAALSAPAVVPCDTPQWDLFGITMAGYNVVGSLGLALLTFWAVLKREWWG